MTAVVSKEHATETWLLGVAGVVILAIAVVMMACAAPSLAHQRPHAAMARPASVHTSAQVTRSGPASWAGLPTLDTPAARAA